MNSEEWELLQALFARATDLPPADVGAFLDRECAGNPGVRAELESMLRQNDEGNTRIQRAIAATAEELVEVGPDPWVGTLVGAYRVTEKIAEGGMGVVYIGERADEQYHQRVAIKILNIGRMSPSLRARFIGERQILASLHHPNIAGLIDGGATEQGVPYLIMDYIDGTAIDVYCNQHRLTLRQRLALFLQVCAAVQYAHQNLVVHRDIKPSNILVDEHATPKLLDFGIAKLLEDDALGTESQELTRQDMRLLTPEFASPEQVRGEKVTTATDVYALGLLLYRLLTGTTPYQFASHSPADIQHAICETRPERPSTVATRLGNASPLDTAGPPIRWTNQLRGDLDNIVLLTLRKEPEQRYATVRQLADDIQRHLDQRPVMAQPASLPYLAGKFIARNRTAVTAFTLMAAVVIGLVTYYTWQLASERDKAQLESRKATEIAAFLTGLFKLSDPAEMKGEAVSAQELLDQGARRIEFELADQPEVQATMAQIMGRNYRNLGLYSQAHKLFLQSLEARRALYGDDHNDTLTSRDDLGLTLVDLGRFDAAGRELQQVLAIREAEQTTPPQALSISRRSLAIAQIELGEYESARQSLLASVQLQRALSPANNEALAATLSVLGRLYTRTGDFPAAQSTLNESLALLVAARGREHPDTLLAMNNLGTVYLEHGEIPAAKATYEEVLGLRRKVFGHRHISVGRVLGNLGTIDYQMGRFDDALEHYQESLEIFQSALGNDHPRVAFLKENIANVYLAKGDEALAHTMYLESLAQIRQIFGAVHIETGMTTSNVGGALIVMKRYEEARSYLDEADAIFRQTVGDAHPAVAANMVKLGQSEQGLTQYAAAEATYREALALAGTSQLPDHPEILKIQYALGDVLMLQGKLDESEALLVTTLAAWRRTESGVGAFTARTAGLLGDCLTRMQRYTEAEANLLESFSALSTVQQAEHEHIVQARERLANLYIDWGRPAKAKPYL